MTGSEWFCGSGPASKRHDGERGARGTRRAFGGPVIVEIRSLEVRLYSAFRPVNAVLARICGVRVLLPDVGKGPLIWEFAVERYRDDEPLTGVRGGAQVLLYLGGLTRINRLGVNYGIM